MHDPDPAGMPPEPDRILDVTGLNCPLPILKTKMALRDLTTGQVLHVLATDPMAAVDFRAFCARTGHDLAYMEHTDAGVLHFYIRLGAPRAA